MHDIYLISHITDLIVKKQCICQLANDFYSVQALLQLFQFNNLPLVTFYHTYYSYCNSMMHNYICFLVVVVVGHP